MRLPMHRIIPAFLLCCISFAGASAQQRTMNGSAAGLLRQWPKAGPWEVVLTRANEGDLLCVMLTGHKNADAGELYLWGFRSRAGAKAVAVADRNAQAVSGEAITISVDGIPAGTFPVIRRRSEGGMSSISSDLEASEFERMSSLLRLGGRIAFSTSMATYGETLQGAAQALAFFSQCTAEVEHLTGDRTGR